MATVRRQLSAASVVEAIGHAVNAMIGQCQSLKCVIDDDQFVLTSCAAHLLQNLDIEHPVGHIFNATIQTHHQTHKCGTKTLVAMTTCLMKHAQCLVQQGIPIHSVVSGLHQGLDTCMVGINDIVIPLSDIIDLQSINKELNEEESHHDFQKCDNLAELNPDIPDETGRCEEFQEIEMKMCTYDTEEITKRNLSDEDDIGWFFEDGIVPEYPSLDTSVINLMSHISDDVMDITTNTDAEFRAERSLMKNGIKMKGGKYLDRIARQDLPPDLSELSLSDSTLVKINKEKHDKTFSLCQRENENSIFSSIKNDLDSDSDFDEYFTQSGSGKDKLNINTLSIQVSQSQNSSEDEFDQCFEDIQFVEEDSRTPASAKNTTSKEQNVLGSNKSDPSKIASQEQFETKLQDLLKKNSRIQSKQTQNQSRHFKTMQTTVEELENSGKKDKLLEENSSDIHEETESSSECKLSDISSLQNTGADVIEITSVCDQGNGEDRLAQILAAKPKLSETVLNQSKHFRTIESTLNALKSSQKQSLQVQSLQNVREINEGHMQMKTGYETETEKAQPFLATTTLLRDTNPRENICSSSNKSREKDIDGNLRIQLRKMVERLAHGRDEIVPFVTETLWNQQQHHREFSYNLSMVHTHCLEGVPERRSDVVNGLVVETSQDMVIILASQADKKHNCLLINGDLSRTFQHIGYNKPVESREIKKNVLSVTKQDCWLNDFAKVTETLGVTAILVKGKADDGVTDLCLNKGIVLITGVHYRVLQAIAESDDVDMAVYIEECTQENVAKSLHIRPLNDDWMDHVTWQPYNGLVTIETPTILTQTAVLCHSCSRVVQMQEEHFWHTASRVSHTLKYQKLLPGGAMSELHLSKCLWQHAESRLQNSSCEDNYVGSVFEAMATAFTDYTYSVHINQGKSLQEVANLITRYPFQLQNMDKVLFEKSDICYDDYTSKLEAYKSAVHLVALFMQTDMEIVTGFTKEEQKVFKSRDLFGYL